MTLKDFFDNDLFRDISFYKTLILIVCLLLIFFIVEPEKLKYTSFIGSGSMLISLLYIWSLCGSLKFPNASGQKVWDFSAFPQLFGSQLYSLECISSLMCVRSTMKDKKQANKMVVIIMSLGSAFFVINGLLISFSFYSPKSITFFYFRHNALISVFEILYYLTVPTQLIIILLSNLTLLEEISWVRSLLVSKSNPGDLSMTKLRIFRMSITMIIIFFSLFGKFFYFFLLFL